MKKTTRISSLILVFFILAAATASAGPQMPDWANPALESLGCQLTMLTEVDGNVVAIGVATEVDKLEAKGFTVFPGSPHRVKVSRIKGDLYQVVVDNMHKDGRNQVKELKLP